MNRIAMIAVMMTSFACTQQAAAADPAEQPALETWLGVSVERASSDLLNHLGLTPGIGLVVTYVDANSPASQAGVQANDLLLRLDDQQLVNPEQLQVLLTARGSGSTAALNLLRLAEEMQLTVTLGEREAATPEPGSDAEQLADWLGTNPGTDFIDRNDP